MDVLANLACSFTRALRNTRLTITDRERHGEREGWKKENGGEEEEEEKTEIKEGSDRKERVRLGANYRKGDEG